MSDFSGHTPQFFSIIAQLVHQQHFKTRMVVRGRSNEREEASRTLSKPFGVNDSLSDVQRISCCS